MKKQLFTLGVLAMIFLTVSAFSFHYGNKTDKDKKVKVKIIREVDGKRTEIDTLIDSKDHEFHIDGMHGKLDHTKMIITDHGNVDVDSLVKSVEMIIKDSIEGDGLVNIITEISDMDDEVAEALENIDIDIADIPHPDSICSKIVITTAKHHGKRGKVYIEKGCMGKTVASGNACVYISDDGKKHVKIASPNHSTLIRPDDPSVISFKKKDLGNGKEKIEIIRKKSSDEDVVIENK